MSGVSNRLPVEMNVVAISASGDSRWTWRIITRDGRVLAQSSHMVAGLIEALEDGRRHLGDLRLRHSFSGAPTTEDRDDSFARGI
jgi:hypothetical protein